MVLLAMEKLLLIILKLFLVEEAFKKAYEKAVLAVNPISLEPGTYDVILEPLAASEYVFRATYIGTTQIVLKMEHLFRR